MKTLNNLINLRGHREQAFKFAFGFHGGMKNCYTKGCEIFAPLRFALLGNDLSDAMKLDTMHNQEREIDFNVVDMAINNINTNDLELIF